MATLREYWATDPRDLLFNTELELRQSADGPILLKVMARAHMDFEAGAKFVSFYVPEHPEIELPELSLLSAVDQVFGDASGLEINTGFGGHLDMSSSDLAFTGRVYFYSEDPVSEVGKARLRQVASASGLSLVFRSQEYVKVRNEASRPLAFVSHDSRDKEDIAEPLAIKLVGMSCPVWYDEFSLSVGDSLRESIERGLKECRRCVLVLTPNFLANGGWAKREYQSIFTRELIEQKRLLLPVWAGVTPEDVFNYSPILADRKGLQWSDGIDHVATKLAGAIRT